MGASFFGIEMSFLWYRGGPSLLLGIEIFFLVSRFCTLLFGIETVFFLGSTCACFWGLDILYIGGQRDLDTEKKIETSRYQKKDISIPTKRVIHYHSPRNFYKLIPLPVFFCNFFVIFTGIRCGTDFFL